MLVALLLVLGAAPLFGANLLGITAGVATNITLGSISNLAAFNTSIATSDISYNNSDLATRTYNVRLPSGFDANNTSKKYGLITYIDAGDAPGFPSTYASALDAQNIIWIAGFSIGNSWGVDVRRGVAIMGAFRMMELYNIDPARVYVSGLSGGSRTASDLGYLRSDYFHGFIGRVGSSLPAIIPNWECAGTSSSNSDADYEYMNSFTLPSIVLPAYFRTPLMTQYGDFRRTENMAIYRYGHLNNGNVSRIIMRSGGHSDEVGPSFTDAVNFLYHPLVDVIWDRFENGILGSNVQTNKTVAGTGFTALSGNVSETNYNYNSTNLGVLKLTGDGAAVQSNDTFTWQNSYGILLDARLRAENATAAGQNEQIGLHIVPAISSGTASNLPGFHLYWCYGQPYRAEIVGADGTHKTLATWLHTATHPMSLASTDKTFWNAIAAPDYAGRSQTFRGEDVRLVLNSLGFQLTFNRAADTVTTSYAGVLLLCSDNSTPYAENLPVVIQGSWSDVETALINALPTGNWRLVLSNDAIVPAQPVGNAVVDEIHLIGSTGIQAAPPSFSVTAPANNQRALTWRQINGAMSYIIQRSTVPDSGYTALTNITNTAASYTDTTATLSGAYYYQVAAIGSDGSTGKWSVVSFAARTGSPPNAPTSPAVTYPADYQARLAWTDNANNETGYRVERTQAGYEQWTLVSGVLAANTTTFTDTSVLAGMAYDYRISAVGSAGISGYATITANIPDVAPPAPTGLSGTGTFSSVNLTWNAEPKAGSYRIKRATTSGGPYTTIATGLTNPAYSDITFTPGGAFYYVVVSVSASGLLESGNSAEVFVTPPVLGAPGNLTVTPGYTVNTLNWSPGSNATSYTVKRATTVGGPYATIASGLADNFFLDTGLTAGTTYYYMTYSANGAALSAPVGPVSGTPSIRPVVNLPPAPVRGANLKLHLDASNSSTIVKDGSNKVSRWNDADGGSNYTLQETASAQPTALTDPNGFPIVDFGTFVASSTGMWMQFKNAAGADLSISTIRSAFIVMQGGNFVLGASGSYHFHRAFDATGNCGGSACALWHSGYASSAVLTGSTYLNGGSAPIDGTTTAMPTNFWLADVITANNTTANRLACDRTYRTGGQRVAEVLIYDRVLTDPERRATEAYLMLKWFGTDLTRLSITTPSNIIVQTTNPAGATVTFATSATNNLDGAVATTCSPLSGSVFPPGINTVTATATNSVGFTASKTFTVTVQLTLTPVQSWRQTNFGTISNSGDAADTADPDHDGIPNLLEYALGLDPNVASPNVLPVPTLASDAGNSYLTLTVNKNSAATDVQFAAEVCDDLAASNWTNTVTVLQNDSAVFKARDNISVTAAPKRFMRLRVITQ